MPKKHFKTNLFFSIMTPPTNLPDMSWHVHQVTISYKTKNGHNLVCWHQKNYQYHTEFVSWRVDHFCFFYFPIRRGGGVSALFEFSNKFFFETSLNNNLNIKDKNNNKNNINNRKQRQQQKPLHRNTEIRVRGNDQPWLDPIKIQLSVIFSQ